MELRDPVSSLSHFFTALWAVFATGIMLRLTKGGWRRQVPVAVYGTSMVVLYLASGVYHALMLPPDQLRLYQKFDQTAIYLLIAGTNTPIASFVLYGARRRWMLGVLWGFAFAGVACQWLLPQAPHAVIVGICLGMGWTGFAPLAVYYRLLGWRAMNWILLGAFFYSFGAICEVSEWPVIVPGVVGYHDFFHFCISAGSVMFFAFILRHVIHYKCPVKDGVFESLPVAHEANPPFDEFPDYHPVTGSVVDAAPPLRPQ